MKVGDTVRFLNDVGGGVVARIEGKTAYVVDSDGFETPALLTQCVVVPTVDTQASSTKQPPIEPKPQKPQKQSNTLKTLNTPNTLNAVLLFEPQDIRRLSQTQFDIYLVNDSPYTLLYAVATRDRLDSEWTLLAHGEAEPGTQEFLGEVYNTELNRFEHISVQLLALKPDAPFELKAPISIETRFDVTRLAKLHCFTATAYSQTPVLTIPVVTNDNPRI